MSFKENYHRDMYRAGLEIRALFMKLGGIASDEDFEAIVNAAEAGFMHYHDSFIASASPLALSLPDAASWVTEIIQNYPDFDAVLLRVSAGDWRSLHNKLSAVVSTYPAFNETLTICRERFGFQVPDTVIDAEPEKLLLLNWDLTPMAHWLTQHDQVQTVVFLQLWPKGQIPDMWL